MLIFADKSQSIEIEPHPDLVNYYHKSEEFNHKLSEDFKGEEEFPNIISNIEQNIFLLNRLNEKGLLKDENNMIDCGIGLGFALFDFYLQSKDLNSKFNFYGIEKEKTYIDWFNQHLISYWNQNLTLIEGDIMNHNYHNYNIAYSYTPFKNQEDLSNFYNKITDEIQTGSIIIENSHWGLGNYDLLRKIDKLTPIKIDDVTVFVKN